MKKIALLITIVAFSVATTSCVKDLKSKGIYTVSEYTGTVVNGNTTQPVGGVLVQLLAGKNIYAASYTSNNGFFQLSNINPDDLDEYCYILVDGSTVGLSQKKLKLSGGGGNTTYDYKLITLY